MNKKLIAMAVAAGVALPMGAANAEPTLYGQLQMEIADYDDGKKTDADADAGKPASGHMASDDNKRGRLGVKGSEDLGGGMKALYNFEWQVDTSDADAYDGTRVGMVGLKGGFGTVQAGTLKMPYKYTGGVKYDPFVTTFMEARSRGGMSGKAADGGTNAKGVYGHHGFMSDAIAYKNKFGAVSVWVATSLDENGGAKGKDGDMNAAVKFSGGNFEAFVAMAVDDQVNDTNDDWGNGTAADDALSGEYSATKFGGMFKMGNIKLKAQIEQTEFTVNKADTDGDGTYLTYAGSAWESDFMFIGAEMKMGKNVFVAQLGSRESTAGAYTEEQDYMAIGVIHKFSKKTRVFVGHSTSETSDNAGSAAVDASVTSLGLRVDF